MRWLIALAAAAGLVVTGCGEAEVPKGIDWDLTSTHAVDDLGLTQEQLEADPTTVRPQDTVTIALPGGHRFTEGSVARVEVDHAAGQVVALRVVSWPMSLEAGGRRAQRWAEQIGLTTEDIEEWVAETKQADAQRDDEQLIGGARLGDDLTPVIALTHDAKAESPMTVTVRLDWK